MAQRRKGGNFKSKSRYSSSFYFQFFLISFYCNGWKALSTTSDASTAVKSGAAGSGRNQRECLCGSIRLHFSMRALPSKSTVLLLIYHWGRLVQCDFKDHLFQVQEEVRIVLPSGESGLSGHFRLLSRAWISSHGEELNRFSSGLRIALDCSFIAGWTLCENIFSRYNKFSIKKKK